MRMTALAVVGVILAARSHAGTVDGPYVEPAANGAWEAWYVDQGALGVAKREQPLRVGDKVTVAAVGSLPSFDVRIRGPESIAPDSVEVSPRAPIFVVADTHGEYEILAEMLKAHRIVGPRLQWIFGRGHLVVLGDMLDRGAHQTEILWLLYALEDQARRAGGGVHLVLGNHELMELRGDARYLNPRYRAASEVLGVREYSELFAPRSLLGQWLRAQPAMLRIGGVLCLHAGVSRDLLDRHLSLAEINGTVRAALGEAAPGDDATRERAEFLTGKMGPLWYRGYFSEQTDFPQATVDDVDRTLKEYSSRTVLVGHTIVPTITPLFGGKVIAVQVYPAREPDGSSHFEALLIRGGKPLRALPDGTLQPLPPN